MARLGRAQPVRSWWLSPNRALAPPQTVPGLRLWFAASDLSGLADAAAVGVAGTSPWISRQGTSVGTQATGVKQPTKQTVGGETCVRFDGSDDALLLSGDALTFSQNVDGCTMFVKLKLNALPGAAAQAFSVSIGTAANTSRLTIRPLSTGEHQVGARRLDADGLALVGTGLPGTTNIRVLEGVVDYANNDGLALIDGVPAGSSTTFGTAGNTSNTAALGAALGARADGLAEWLSCDIYEVLVYQGALSAGDRQTVETYLGVGGAAQPELGSSAAAASTTATHVKVAVQRGVCGVGAAATATAKKVAAEQGSAAGAAAATGLDSVPAAGARAQTGASPAGVAATAAEKKLAKSVGASAAGASGTAADRKVAVQRGACSAGSAGSSASRKVAASGGTSAAGAVGTRSGVVARPQTGMCSGATAGTAAARKVAIRVGIASA